MPPFKFVTVEGGSRKPSQPSTSIRSHAIRAGLRKSGPLATAKAAVTQPLEARKPRKEIVCRFELHRGARKQGIQTTGSSVASVKSATPKHRTANMEVPSSTSLVSLEQPPMYQVESVWAASIDPFNCLPIPTNPSVDFLVKYFLIRFNLDFEKLDRKRAWFPYALQSAPMMHSTLAMAAALWRAECPGLDSAIQLEGLRQKGKAMREVSFRLARASSMCSNEEMAFVMSTMSTLVIVEICDNNFDAAEMHLQGVNSIFKARGGWDSFKHDFILCKSISLADLQVAAAVGHQPRFPILKTEEQDDPPAPMLDPTPLIEHTTYPPFDESITEHGSRGLVQIFGKLRQLLSAQQSQAVSLETLRAPLHAIEDLILQHLYRDSVNVSDAGQRSNALVLAAHIFMYVTLRRVSPRLPLLRRMCLKLQNVVGCTSPSRAWNGYSAALLWIAFVGLLGTGEEAGSCPEGRRFFTLFQSALYGYPYGFPLGSYNSLHDILSTFLWDEACCQPLLAGLEQGVITPSQPH
ncbi:hypothetical protein BX600DRAFT_58962 [Xylariales sp. PMI_506]|nr:hypothetical protein BX600DRAFT_58962 [Xylariales sp. PMI_506]